jgi:tRNA nucleotidyltransferase (CCA-adding enzyme)
MHEDLEYYLVGGAVRDALLGIEVVDRDWVVVGSTPEHMTSLGFRAVGRDFPVFLHPETGEEYALARTERKTGRGYGGFTVWTAPDVTLEQDLARRDLTINAMAQDANGHIIDPFNGRTDLDDKILRHVSDAFAEDPLRVLRVARFMARFAGRGFVVADETLALMKQIVANDELEALTAERAWQEISRALMEDTPAAFIETLRDCGALARILPEVDVLFGVPQTPEYHPEIDTGVHILMVLEVAAELSQDLEVRFASLVHDLGKGLTPAADLPRHVGHEARGVAAVEAVCRRFKVPSSCEHLARLVCRHHLLMHQLEQLKATTLLRLITALDAVRRPHIAEWFALACEADSRGRAGRQGNSYPQRALLTRYCDAVRTLDLGDVGAFADREGGIAAEVERRRIRALERVREANRDGAK